MVTASIRGALTGLGSGSEEDRVNQLARRGVRASAFGRGFLSGGKGQLVDAWVILGFPG